MPPPHYNTSLSSSHAATSQSSTVSSPHSWLQTPWPIRVLFSYFPLKTLTANPLPERTLQASARNKHTLFIFTSANSNDADAHLVPSFNPTCLKWQTHMLMHEVEFRVAASNNHASPSGALPFLIPAEESRAHCRKRQAEDSESKDAAPIATGNRDRTGNDSPPSLVTTSSLESWILERSKRRSKPHNASANMRCEAYLSLIEHRIRPAWLHALYLTPNLHSIVAPLYIHPTTTSQPVRQTQTHSLRLAARAELLKVYPTLSTDQSTTTKTIYAGADAALEALNTLLEESGQLGEEQESKISGHEGKWFLGAKKPGLLDAAVFAYTFLLLDNEIWGGRWVDENEDGGVSDLRGMARKYKALEEHMERLREFCFGQRFEQDRKEDSE